MDDTQPRGAFATEHEAAAFLLRYGWICLDPGRPGEPWTHRRWAHYSDPRGDHPCAIVWHGGQYWVIED